MSESRKAFENQYDSDYLGRDEDGYYKWMSTQEEWELWDSAWQAARAGQAASVPEWTDINLRQPEEYQDVLWFCQGGNIRTGMYYGKTHCDRVPETHPISRRGRSHYGKFGRYADPAESGHVVTHWMPLPQPPKQEKGQ